MDTIQLTRKENYAIVQLNRGKVNAINHQMVNELRSVFKELLVDDKVGGVILTGIPRFFSAGLDVIELYQYDEQQIRSFMTDFGMLHIEMAKFPKPLICGITGYSPAGGTVLAITADYRIMTEGEKYTMGLNEVAVNIQISNNLIEAYGFWIGKGLAHRYVLEGKLLNVQEALAVGLVDEVVEASQVLAKAEEKMKHYLKALPVILHATKAKLRKSWLDKINDNSAEDFEQSLQIWWQPETRRRMKMFVERLTNKV